jgi:hypothetical protein
VTGSPASQNPAGIKTLLGALLGVVVIGLLMTYIVRCPCERIPGTVLFGVEVEEPVRRLVIRQCCGVVSNTGAGCHSVVRESQLYGR